jgi:hypothetical protein
MIARFRKYHRIITRCAHQVFCKSCGNLAMFAAIRRALSLPSNLAANRGAFFVLRLSFTANVERSSAVTVDGA